MTVKDIEGQLISHCNGARMITREELKTFIKTDGKVSEHTLAEYLKGVSFIRLEGGGRGGTRRYFIKELAQRMNELTDVGGVR